MLFNLIIMKAEEGLEAYKEGIYLTSVASHCKKPQATGQNETTKISLSYIKLMTMSLHLSECKALDSYMELLVWCDRNEACAGAWLEGGSQTCKLTEHGLEF